MSEWHISGELAAGGHRLVQRVYYEDTDFSGAVYHARYLHFFERGRTDFLRCIGVEQGGAQDFFFVVHRMDIIFRRPARMDDVLEIHTRSEEAGRAKLVLDQVIARGEEVLASARVTVAVVDHAGRPRRMPATIAEKLNLEI